jgi:flagellar biosynthetic protein FlhB
MANDHDTDAKTELPTNRRRQELRERGSVARSSDLNVATLALVAAAILNYFSSDLARALQELLRRSLSARAWLTIDTPLVMTELVSLALTVGGAIVPLLALVVAAAVAINVLQVGFLVTTTPLAPDLERINPLAGFRRLWSLQSTVRLIAGIVKLAVSCAIVAGFVSARLPQFLQGINADTAGFCQQIGGWLAALAFQLALGLTVLAILDYGFQVWKFEQDIKMTPQEIREELRQTEGDPQIRQRRREVHRKLVETREAEAAELTVVRPS